MRNLRRSLILYSLGVKVLGPDVSSNITRTNFEKRMPTSPGFGDN